MAKKEIVQEEVNTDIIDSSEESFEVEVEIIRINEKNPLPCYKVDFAAGLDVYANLKEDLVIGPKDQAIIPLGIKVNTPEGFYFQLTCRSGLAYNNGLVSHFGIIDCGYADEVNFICWNFGNKAIIVKNGDRVGQLILLPYPTVKWVEVDNFGDSYNRGGGHGSTGIA